MVFNVTYSPSVISCHVIHAYLVKLHVKAFHRGSIFYRALQWTRLKKNALDAVQARPHRDEPSTFLNKCPALCSMLYQYLGTRMNKGSTVRPNTVIHESIMLPMIR